MPLRARVDGQTVARTLLQLAVSYERALIQAARRFAGIELTEMKKRTPVETGALRASGVVTVEFVDGHLLIVFEFGGPAAEYAGYVHWDLEAFHRVGQALYVKSVLDESGPYAPQRIALDAARIAGVA
jgi:hypothetical protein